MGCETVIPFQKMWEDALSIISKKEIKDVNIVETYKGGFIVEEGDITEFVNKDDFVDFWCKMLCFKEFSKNEAKNHHKLKYVYKVIEKLPYVNESCDTLKLLDSAN